MATFADLTASEQEGGCSGHLETDRPSWVCMCMCVCKCVYVVQITTSADCCHCVGLYLSTGISMGR